MASKQKRVVPQKDGRTVRAENRKKLIFETLISFYRAEGLRYGLYLFAYCAQ